MKTFGNKKAEPLLFLDDLLITESKNAIENMAQKIADNNFFVIIYNTSVYHQGKLSFQEVFNDLKVIYKDYQLSKATIIGYGYGGIISTLFAEQYPEMVKAIILANVPISLQDVYKELSFIPTMEQNRKEVTTMYYSTMLDKMNKNLIQYDSNYFIHDMRNAFYETEEVLKDKSFEIEDLKKFSSINLISNIKYLLEKKVKLFGIYNCHQKHFSAEQVLVLQHLIGINHLKFISHTVPNNKNSKNQFANVIKNWIKENDL